MTGTNPKTITRERPSGSRDEPVLKPRSTVPQAGAQSPAAGAHAAAHLVNEDATPGSGALPSHSHDGKEVDGGAG